MVKVSQAGHVCIYCVPTILVPVPIHSARSYFALTGKLALVKPLTLFFCVFCFSNSIAYLPVVAISMRFPHSFYLLYSFIFSIYLVSKGLRVLHLSAAWGWDITTRQAR